ncbi:MAG: hypothetical protein ACLP3Q_05310 [Streptosporangiaceae bacterium]
MSSSVNTTNLNLPRLELPNWLPLPVADEARFLYDTATKPSQTVERHVDEQDQTVKLKSTEEASRGHYGTDPPNSRIEAVYRTFDALQQHHQRFAEKLRSMTFEQIALLCRLVSDARMKNVWRELYRKTRGGKQFLNPARPVYGFPGLHNPQNQDMAAHEFFINAFGHAAWPAPLMTRDDYKSRLKSFITMAARLREDAQNLRSLGLSEFAPNLEAIAVACEERRQLVPIHHPVVTRSRGDELVRGFVLRMNVICRLLFEKDLHGTVATTAGVAFSKEISGNQVRDMVRAHESSAASTDTC